MKGSCLGMYNSQSKGMKYDSHLHVGLVCSVDHKDVKWNLLIKKGNFICFEFNNFYFCLIYDYSSYLTISIHINDAKKHLIRRQEIYSFIQLNYNIIL